MMGNMNDTSAQLVQPPPHDVPASPSAYANWSLAGVGIYLAFLALAATGGILWLELRALRRSADDLLAKISDLRASLRPEARR